MSRVSKTRSGISNLYPAVLFFASESLILAFPPFDIESFAWVSLVPLFFLLKGRGRGRSVLMGYLWGIAFFTGILYWVGYAVSVYGRLPLYTSLIITFLLVLYLSIYPAIFALAFNHSEGRGSLFKTIFLPCVWVGLEYLRGHLFTGFPWELLGYSQYRAIPLIQFADITGVYGVSFILVLFNTTLFLSIEGYMERKGRNSLLYPGGITIALLVVVSLYGFFRLNEIEGMLEGWGRVKVGVVQGSIDQDKKWDKGYQMETLRIYSDETKKLIQEGTDLVVWPETATPFYLQADDTLTAMVFDNIIDTESMLLTGSPGYRYRGGKVYYLNSAFLLSSKGFEGRYDKIHLVPFGEYVPLKGLFRFAHKLVQGVGDFITGDGVSLFDIDGKRFGVVICYEAIFPDLFRRFVRDGASFMVNITNDAWFGRTSAPFQHFSHTVFRAVENRVFVVRAANTGISGIISPTGRIVKATPIFKRLSFSASIGVNRVLDTFYTTNGDVFAILSIFISIVMTSLPYMSSISKPLLRLYY